jgi:hypothetical protein
MSVDSFERNVMPEIRVIRMGALVLVPVVELERWPEGTRRRRCWRRAGDTGLAQHVSGSKCLHLRGCAPVVRRRQARG